MRVGQKIYLDYQASTPVASEVLAGMIPYFKDDFGNPHSSDHALGWSAGRAIEQARYSVAELIGAGPDEVFFTSGATESINSVFHAVSRSRGERRTKILVSAIEHSCVLAAARAYADLLGLSVEVVPVDSAGIVDVECFRSMLDDSVLLVAIMAVNNEIGTLQRISELSNYAHEHGALFFCDAAQAPLVSRIDVDAWGVDYLSLSAHKIYGPKGIGCLYVRRELIGAFQPLLHGGGQQNGVRPGTLPTPLCVGFGLAADLVLERRTLDYEDLVNKRRFFITCLHNRSVRFSLNGAQGELVHPGCISITFHGVDAHSVLMKLSPVLCASVGSACSSGFIEGSHVLRAIGLSAEAVAGTLRISLGRYTDLGQLEESAELLASAITTITGAPHD